MDWAPSVDLRDDKATDILFLDEINAAPGECTGGGLSPIPNRRIGTYKRPNGVIRNCGGW